jgi:mannose-6-phosphate isomerase-like protein (cupin superfamily)
MYVLAAGSSDPQSPHEEDEVYYVLSGASKMELGTDIRKVHKGDLIYVPARMPHRFTDIEEDLELLVFFSRMRVD